jgi:hypothetical protein
MVELNMGPNSASPADVTGGRRHRSKKLRLVKKKTVRRMLAKQGLKMRGGGAVEGYAASVNGSAGNSAPVGGRRRSKKRTHRRRGMFHF